MTSIIPSFVSIIGTAGRKEDAGKVDKKLFEQMNKVAERIIKEVFGLDNENVTLVSGGAAVADHVAVSLYIGSQHSDGPPGPYRGIHIHLPCAWDADRKRASEKTYEGRTMNSLHERFSKDTDQDSLHLLHTVRYLGGSIVEHKGFNERNSIVAQSRFLIAFTWGDDEIPKPGRTLHTWKEARRGFKVHIQLSKLSEIGPQGIINEILRDDDSDEMSE